MCVVDRRDDISYRNRELLVEAYTANNEHMVCRSIKHDVECIIPLEEGKRE